MKIHFNITLPSTRGSFKWSPCLRFPHLYAPLLSPIRAKCPCHLIFLYLITRIIFGEGCRSLISSSRSFFHSSFTSPPLITDILRHSKRTLLSQFEQSGFTPIQNNRLNYCSVCSYNRSQQDYKNISR